MASAIGFAPDSVKTRAGFQLPGCCWTTAFNSKAITETLLTTIIGGKLVLGFPNPGDICAWNGHRLPSARKPGAPAPGVDFRVRNSHGIAYNPAQKDSTIRLSGPQPGSMADTFIHSSGPNTRKTPPGSFCDCPQPGHLLTLDSDRIFLNGMTEQAPELFPGQGWRRHVPGKIPELSKPWAGDPWNPPIHFEESGTSIGKFCHLIPECLPVSATGIAHRVERDSQPQPLSIPSWASPNGNRDHGVAPSVITAWLHPGDHLHRFAGTEDTD